MVRKTIFILFLVLISFQTLPAQMQRSSLNLGLGYNENIYSISDYSSVLTDNTETMSLPELLQRGIDGFVFRVEPDRQSGNLMLLKSGSPQMPFDECLKLIGETLEQDTSRVLTLFIDNDPEYLTGVEQLFESEGLLNSLYIHTKGNDWPALNEMVMSGERLVVFSINNIEDHPEWMNYIGEYAIWQDDPYWNDSPLDNEIFEDLGEKRLFVFTGYSDIEKRWQQESSIYNVRLPFFIEPFRETWIRNGMVPNFLIIDQWSNRMNEFLTTIRDFSLIKGSVTHNNDLLDDVYWVGLNGVTFGDFCFPLMTGDRITLTPRSPGYKMVPESITIYDTSVVVPNFTALSLDISEDLELFLQFEGNADNFIPSVYKGVPENVDFIDDPIRGNVVSFDNGGSIPLPTAKELNMTNHDFTISVWLKISRYLPNKNDYCIIGSGQRDSFAYLQEMHFLIRNEIPYFGFFANDIAGSTVLEAGKWYHIACRYNSDNGEQAIFVNGELDSRSFNRPPYKGTDSLFVGIFGNRNTTHMNGELDNLTIWSRALGDKEIMGLSNGLISIDIFNIPGSRGDISKVILIVSGSILFLVLVILLLRKRMVVKIKGKDKVVDISPTDNATKNYIKLFGDFQVVDRHGNDITMRFSPKVKHLFMAILINSLHENPGITSSELTQMLWGKNLSRNLDNVRGVTTRKLRGILEELDKIEIVFQNDRWFVKFYKPVRCDYHECLAMIESGVVHNIRYFNKFLSIVQEGELFRNESFDWLDSSKGFVSNTIVDVLLRYLEEGEFDSDTVLRISEIILINDPVNDTALAYKVAIMIRRNNKKLARYNFDQFCSLYNEMYGEQYNRSFDQFVLELPVIQRV